MKGGKREGSGRKKGSKTKKHVDIALRAAAQGITPLEYMLEVLRDKDLDRDVRLDAAKSAAPFIHPRLSNIEANVSLAGHEAALEQLD